MNNQEAMRMILAGINQNEYERQLERCVALGCEEAFLRENGFDETQLAEIRKGLEEGIDIKRYANPEYPWFLMETIREGLLLHVPTDEYIKIYDWQQLQEIIEGCRDGLEVSVYLNPELDASSMKEIRLSLAEGLPIEPYAKPVFDYMQLHQIRRGLQDNLPVEIFAQPELDCVIMREIRKGLEFQVDVLWLAKMG